LQKLGFYSGEEDMEFSSFSTVLRAGSEGEAVQELQVPFLFYFFGVNYEE
jgi:hypothetical protein